MPRLISTTFRTLGNTLCQAPFSLWAWAALASLPLDWLTTLGKLELAKQVLLQLGWLPFDSFFQIQLWRCYGRLCQPGLAPQRPALQGALSYLNFQILLGLRLVPVALLGVLPGCFLLALLHPQSMRGIVLASLPVLLGLLPALVWVYHRLLGPAFIAWQDQPAAQAFNSSVNLLRGTFKARLGFLVTIGIADALLSNLPSAILSSLPIPYLILSALCLPASLLLESAALYTLFQTQNPS